LVILLYTYQISPIYIASHSIMTETLTLTAKKTSVQTPQLLYFDILHYLTILFYIYIIIYYIVR